MKLFDIFNKKNDKLTEEQLKWNKMWELWTEEKIESPCKELMTYQSEINNGGHSQYFSNTDDCKNELSALERILSPALTDNLKKAYKAYISNTDSEEFLAQYDDVFYEHEEEILRILEDYAYKTSL